MKQIFTIIAITLFYSSILAQTPEKISYQSVVRDVNNNLLSQTQVGIQIRILQGSINGTPVYEEIQNPTTNINGLLTIEIGVQTGFDTINWANGIYFIETGIDPTNGINYSLIMGTSQLLTVPYALHAKTAESITGTITETDPVFIASPSNGITNANITNWDNKIDIELDSDSTNEIQSLLYTGNQLSISKANTINLDFSNNIEFVTRAEMDTITPTNGQLIYNTTDNVTLMWNGSNWIQISDNCFPQPTASIAGTDQEINSNTLTTNLAANTPTEGIGAWSIINGASGSFADINNPTTAFSGSSCTNYNLQWEIATACTQSKDTVNISFNTLPTIANAGIDIYSLTQTTVTLNGNNPTIGTGVWSIVSGLGGSFSNPNSYNSNFTGNNNETYTLRWSTIACDSSYDYVKVYIGNVVGQYAYGGVIFYVYGSGNNGFVCATTDQSSGTIWGCSATSITGAYGTSIGTGAQNTINIEAGCPTVGTAADICANLSLNTYTDWFLPSKDELYEMFINKDEINTAALNNGGTIFDVTSSSIYWSSSEYSVNNAWYYYFVLSSSFNSNKNSSYRVRAIRAF